MDDRLRAVRRLAVAIGAGGAACVGFSGQAFAQTAGNAPYQDFFGLAVCNQLPNGTAVGPPVSSQLGDRCLDTQNNNDGTFANISGNSESSLNPNQVSAAASNALAGAKALAAETEARLEALRDEEDGKPVTSGSGTIAGFGPWSIFANVQGEWFDQDRIAYQRNERGFDGHRYGGSFGADYRLSPAARLGVMFHYEKYSSKFDSELPGDRFNPNTDNSGGFRSKTASVTVYTTVSLTDDAWFDASAGYGWSKNRLRRDAIFQPSDRDPISTRDVDTSAKADGDQLFASLGLGYDFSDGPASITPYARLRYIRTTIDELEETGGNNLGMIFSRQKATSLTATVGASASYAISASWGVIVPSLRLEVEHEFKDDPRTVEARFVFDTRTNPIVLPVTGDAPDRSYSNAGVGLVFVLPGGVMPYVDYEALLGYSNFHRSRVTAGLRLEF